MTKNTLWSAVGVVVSVVFAWWVVSVVFSLVWFVVKLIVVAIVAVIAFFALRALFRKSDR